VGGRQRLPGTSIYFHTKMRLKQLDLDTYLFGEGVSELPPRDAKRIRECVDHEIMEIFYDRNIQR